MSRHAIQIKELLQSKRLSKSKITPINSYQSIPDCVPSVKNLKRCQSSSSLRKKKNQEMIMMEQKFKKLEQNYKSVLQQTRSRAILFTKQKKQLQKYKQQSEQDKKEIQRLRSMLGFMKKEDFSTQTDTKQEQICSVERDLSKISFSSKAQQSTSAELRITDENWVSKDPKRSTHKQSRVKTPYKLLNNRSQTTICFRSTLKQSNIKSHLSKYKFVPTIQFK